jgi:hypothetical protein
MTAAPTIGSPRSFTTWPVIAPVVTSLVDSTAGAGFCAGVEKQIDPKRTRTAAREEVFLSIVPTANTEIMV